MSIITLILATVVALEHLYIMYLETFATASDNTARVFGMEKTELERPSLNKAFKNQGIYNGLVGLFLLYGLYLSSNAQTEITAIFLLFVIAAATYGAVTVDKKILLTQGGPAILAFLTLLFL